MIWKYFKHIDNNIILNFPKPSNSQLLFNRLFGTLLAFFFIRFCIIIGFKEAAKIPNTFVRSKIEKVPRGVRGEKSSKDMASSRNLVSTIGALASPKMRDGTRCDVHISGYSLFCHYRRFKNFFSDVISWFFLFLRSLDLFISYTMVTVVNFCKFPLTLSCNLCIHLFFNTCY